ncbi:MAG: thiol-activated cytolysin family protein [Clostridiales bacterium]|jgi:thiol-activated cytolysin|nr:thiol-activated cytolysin family protein [Clostridiales bacterium]
MTVDAYINSLIYDPRSVLADRSPVPSCKKEEGELRDDGTFLVTKKKLCTVNGSTSELTYIDSLATRLYPGCLLLCNNNLVGNVPSVVNLPTKPVNFSIDLPGGNGKLTAESLGKGAVENAVEQKIAEWRKTNKSGNIASKVRYNVYEVKSRHKLEADLGFKLEAANQSFNIDFGMIEKSQSREWILKYEQIYYNVTLDGFVKPSDIIADSVTSADLIVSGVDDDNPLGVINNVNYGRIVYVHFKTEDAAFDVKGRIGLVIGGSGAGASAGAKAELDNMSGKVSADVFVYGGGTSSFAGAPQIRLDTVADFIARGYNFDAGQVAAPIGYSVAFIKNGGQDLAVINSSTTYIESETKSYGRARLIIEHKGAFINVFNITWNEVSYPEEGGGPISAPKSWERNGKRSFMGHKFELTFGGNARDIRVHSAGLTGLIWDKTRDNFSQSYETPPAAEMRLVISGLPLRQRAEMKY